MPIYAYLQEIPRPFWIMGMVLGFIWFWPVGLVILAFLISTRSMRRQAMAAGTWHNTVNTDGQRQGHDNGRPWGWGPGGMFNMGCGRTASSPQPTANRAFDEYRADTLRRLEDEQKEFMEYLERLRQARDKQEFDQFMADRRRVEPTT